MSTIEEQHASAAAAIEAANAATAALVAATGLITQQAQPSQQIRVKKPDLPEFDKNNVEVWLKRVQSAYDRAGIVTPKDKFAFLESRFAVGANPSIDAFLYGPATESAWTEFVSYLTNEYGRTVRQEAQYLRGQFSRDGRKPSQMLAQMKEKAKRVTVDDIMKEIILSTLPTDVQQIVAERVKDLSADQTASIADNYFDQDGRPLYSRAAPVQHIDAAEPEETQREYNNHGEVNAIRGGRGGFRGNARGNFNGGNRFSRPFSNNNNSRNGNNNASWPPNRMGVKNRSYNNGRGGQHQTPPSASSTSSSASAADNTPKSVVLCLNQVHSQPGGPVQFT